MSEDSAEQDRQLAQAQHGCKNGGSDNYVDYRFSQLKEGDIDPTLGKRIDWLIDGDDEFIVYIDEDFYVEWNMNDNAMLGEQAGEVLNKVAYLESYEPDWLNEEQKVIFARLIAEGVARAFYNDLKSANEALAYAETWIKSRTPQIARRWYLQGASLAAGLALAVVAGFSLCGQPTGPAADPLHSFLLASFSGGIGAWFSVLQRSGSTAVDFAAGPWVHYLDGFLRIVSGVVGASIVALAIKANIVSQINSFAAIIFTCVVAGFSERLVPNILNQMENRARPPETPAKPE